MLKRDGARLLNIAQLTKEIEGLSRDGVEIMVNQPGFRFYRLPGKKRKYYLEYKVVEWMDENLEIERV